MFGKMFSRRKVTKTVTTGGTTETTTVEDVTGDPAAAEAERVLKEAENLFAHADEVFAAMRRPPAAAKKKPAAEPPPPAPEPPPPAPDFLADFPRGTSVRLGSRTVVRYKGRYYGWSSHDPTRPIGYYALDTMRPTEGQP